MQQNRLLQGGLVAAPVGGRLAKLAYMATLSSHRSNRATSNEDMGRVFPST